MVNQIRMASNRKLLLYPSAITDSKHRWHFRVLKFTTTPLGLPITVYGLLTLPNLVVIPGSPAQIRTVMNSAGHIAIAIQGPDRRIFVS